MTDPLIDAANAISDASPKIKAYAQMQATRTLAIEARLAALENPDHPPAGPPAPPGTPISFGSFPDSIGGEFADTTWNWWSPHVTLLPGAAPDGTNAALIVTDDSMTFPNQGNNVRCNAIQFKQGLPSWFTNGHEVWRQISVKVPSGYSNTQMIYACDEYHGDNGTGPAPYNLSFQRGGYWRIYVRGSGPYTPPAFNQWIFGPDDGSGSTPGRHHQDWQGGNKVVVVDEWITFLHHWNLATDTSGSYDCWAKWGGTWRNIVPPVTGIPTSYPDTSGDGKPIYPVLCMYYPAGKGGQNAVVAAQGKWWGK